ncbi:cysteine desulfurase [Planctomycetales bacterium]|nr:cysteine desulfurase [Planctomycetales bacterium]
MINKPEHNGTIIYLDNAATAFPKPESVYQAVNDALRYCGGNPGRAGHRLSLAAGKILDEARLQCSLLFNAQPAGRIIFTSNATAAINTALKGLLRSGDNVICGTMEHNAVARPLYNLQQKGVSISFVKTDIDTGISVKDLEAALQKNTRLFVCSHISNVFGTVNDIQTLGNFCKERDIIFMVDSAQSAGCRHIDVQKMNINLLAFSGHKSLLGPQGTGGLYVQKGLELETLIEGGTGNNSEFLEQPAELPFRFESGTPNTAGLAGLAAGIRFVRETGIENIAAKESQLVNQLVDGLSEIKGVKVFTPQRAARQSLERGNAVSIQLEKYPPEIAAAVLDNKYGIAVRSGLHCAGEAHRAMNTLQNGGTLRISPAYFNEKEDIIKCIEAIKEL